MNPRTKVEQLANHGWKQLMNYSIVEFWHIERVIDDNPGNVKDYTEDDKQKANRFLTSRLKELKVVGVKLGKPGGLEDQTLLKELQRLVRSPIRE